MLEVEATADVLLMTQPFTAHVATDEPVEVVLVKAVLSGERDRFARLYEMYAPLSTEFCWRACPAAKSTIWCRTFFCMR